MARAEVLPIRSDDEKRDKRDRDPDVCVCCNRGEHERCAGGDCQCRCGGRLKRAT